MKCESFRRITVTFFAIIASGILPLYADDTPKSPAIDVNNPKTWKRQVKIHNAAGLEITRQLIAIEKNEKHSVEVRIDAIDSLAKLHNEDARRFFVDNILRSYVSAKLEFFDDRAFARMNLCEYSLRLEGWSAVPTIISALDRPRSPAELRVFSSVLKRAVGERNAYVIVRGEFEGPTDTGDRAPKLVATQHRNLKLMVGYLIYR